MKLLESLFGANWRTTLASLGSAITGLLTIIAALPYELGDIATIIPPEWKAKVVLAGALATAILHSINGVLSKDGNISGNGSPFNGFSANDGTLTGRKIAPLILLALIPALWVLPFILTGCVTGADGKQHLAPLTDAQKADLARVEQVVSAAVGGAMNGAAVDAEQQLLTTGKVDPATLEGSAAFGALGAAIRAITTPTPAAIAQSASNYTTSPGTPPAAIVGVAPTISGAISLAVKNGVPQQLAIESAAKGADAAAKALNTP